MRLKQTGFTLLEILLSLFITGIIATMLVVILNTGLRAYRQGRDLLEITRKAQFVLGQMTREITGAMVQQNGAQNVIPFQGNANSVVFMAPVENSSDVDLCEVGYVWNNDGTNVLNRQFDTRGVSGAPNPNYQYPNTVNYNNGTQNTFCTDISSFALSYNNGTSWAVPGNTSVLPRMVEVQLTVRGQGGNSRTFTTWIYLQNS